jgi:hypothetical protein
VKFTPQRFWRSEEKPADPMDKAESFHFEKLVLGRRTMLLKVAVRDLLDQLDIGNGGERKNVAMLLGTMLHLAPMIRPTAAEVVEALKAISTSNM